MAKGPKPKKPEEKRADTQSGHVRLDMTFEEAIKLAANTPIKPKKKANK